MQIIKHTATKLYQYFLNMKLTQKLILGFAFVVLLPTIILEYSLYNQNYNAALNQYVQNENASLEIAQKNLKIQLKEIEKSSDFLTNSNSLVSYLSGLYNSESEEVYYYIKDIQPLINHFLGSNDSIQNITFYSQRSYSLNWANRLHTVNELPFPRDSTLSSRDLINGIWYKATGNTETISFFQQIYSDNYSQAIAVLQINVSLISLMDSFSALTGDLYAFFSNDTEPLYFSEHRLSFVSSDSLSTDSVSKDHIIFCETNIDELQLIVFQKLDLHSALNYNGNTLLTLLILLALLLSAGYYFITVSITRRIVRLQKHISCVKADNLIPLADPEYKDEVGQLTSAYNHLINRINDLLFQIYHTELAKKDAEFYALQAQIEPHFLYNILENIHMSAEQANDTQTATMVTLLGKFMRYNLNTNTGIVHLFDELTHAKNYLDIHKIRMQERLNVQISVFTDIDDIACPRFILQPLLENALKYATIPNKTLIITITVKDRFEGTSCKDVLLEIHDNGSGMTQQELVQLQNSLKNTDYIRDTHIGLNSINNRLQTFYGNDYSLQIESRPMEGTSIIMYLKREVKSNENTSC